MHLRQRLFATFICCHVAAWFATPEAFAPVVASTVYLPLMLLKEIGVAVFTTAKSGGWSSPSLLGWAIIFLLWLIIWWVVAFVLSYLLQKRDSNV